jgi:hypothetical protein
LLRTFSFGAAVTYSSYFLRFNSLDERVVAAEFLPSSVVEAVFFLYGCFAQYVLGVSAAVGNELEIVLEVCRLAV